MRETLFFDIKPISLNQCNRAIYRPKRGGKGFVSNIKSEQYRKFEAEFYVELKTQDDKLRKIAEWYKHGKNFFINSYVFKFPRADLITKAGAINKRCADVDNLLKPVNDQLFKYMAGINKDIDDSAIMGLKALKVPSDVDAHKIIIELTLRESLEGYTIY